MVWLTILRLRANAAPAFVQVKAVPLARLALLLLEGRRTDPIRKTLIS